VQTLIFGLQVAALGIGIVFVALVFLIFVIKGMTKATELSEVKKNTDNSMIIKKEAVPQEAPLIAEDDDEIMAVIAAAVACLTQGKLRIKTIRRVKEENVPVWSAAGRQETMCLRQNR
jgi:sodium pump decarboxylase gamma subunit